MIQFFIKHKKIKGVITIFLTIIYLAAYIFAGVFVDGARVKMAQTVIEDVQQIANENIMAEYDRGLYEYYGLMATCGYDPDTIAKEVQEEINAAIGLQFEVDEVKAFITNCFINAANGYGITNLNNDNTKEVKNINSFFKPYQLDVKVASVSTIDLTDIDALRAQINDEMRYKFPIILGASFFDEFEKFLTIGNAANEIKSVVDEISDEKNSLLYQQSVYYENINKFYEEYYTFLKELYGNNIEIDNEDKDEVNNKLKEVVNRIQGGLKEILKNATGFFINIIQFGTGLDITGKLRNIENNKNKKNIYTAITKITSNSDDENFIINKYSNEYNNQPWPQANDFAEPIDDGDDEDSEDDEDDEIEYELNEEEFKEAINNKAIVKNDIFKNNIDKFKQKINKLFEYEGEGYKYVKNINIPCASEFIGCGINLLKDLLKNKVKFVFDTIQVFTEKNWKNKLVKFSDLPKNLSSTANSFLETIKSIKEKIYVTGVIPEDATIGIEAMFPSITLKLGGIEDLIKSNEEYMGVIEEKLDYFVKGYNKYSNDENNQEIQNIYASYLEMFLISWAELKTDHIIYEKIKESIYGISEELDKSCITTENFTNSIVYGSLNSVYDYYFDYGEEDEDDDDEDEDDKDHVREYLKNRQTVIVDKIKKYVEDINEGGLNNLTFTDVDMLQTNLVRLCSAVFNIMTQNKINLFQGSHESYSYFYWKEKYPEKSYEEILALINSGGEFIFCDPWEHIMPYEKKSIPIEALNDLDDNSFNVFKIPSTVSKILSVPIEIVERLPKEFTNDMNDVSYILSHFRDYVHTYRADVLEVFDINGNKKDKEYDNFLNAHFNINQSDTEYISNKDYEKLQVTPAEIEYILFGNEGENSNVKNVISMYTAIFLIRTAINYVSVFFSADAIKSVTDISSAFGAFAPLGMLLAPLIYALPQSAIETKTIMYDCKKVNIINTNFGLFDPYKNEIFKEIENITQTIKERAKTVLKNSKEKIKKGLGEYLQKEIVETFKNDMILNYDNVSGLSDYEMPTILLVLNNIDNINEPIPSEINEAKEALRRWLTKKIHDSAQDFLKDEEDVKIVDNNTESLKKYKITTGYSTYLTLLLFLFGCTFDGKTEQMTRVQNVIETNMKRVYEMNGVKDDKIFKLKNAYVRTAVETECSINYIFMTNAFMPTNIKFSSDDRFKFKIKTASAY